MDMPVTSLAEKKKASARLLLGGGNRINCKIFIFLPQLPEKVPQQCGACFGQDTIGDNRMMIIGQCKEIDQRAAGACFGIGRTIDDPGNSGVDD